MRGFGRIPDIAALIRATKVAPMSIAEAYDMPAARAPLVPPSPPRAPDDMTAFGRMKAIRISPIGSWGQRAYEEDIVQGRFLGRNSFIVNAPDAIKHVLVDNYENYTSTPVGIRVLRPILGEGLLIAEGRAWKHQRRTLAPAFTPRAVIDACSAHAGGDRRDGRQAQGRQQRAGRPARGDAADDAGNRRPHHVLVRDGSARRRVARLRDGVWRAAGAAAFSRSAAAAGWPSPQDFVPRPFPQALDGVRRHADGRAPRRRQERGRAGARPVRPDG